MQIEGLRLAAWANWAKPHEETTRGKRRGKALMSQIRLWGVIVFLCISLVTARDAMARSETPEVTHDGLHLVKHTKLRQVYMKPGASLAAYDKVVLLDCFVAFKKNWQRDRDFSSRISHHEMDKIKTELAAEFHKIFVAELQAKGGYQVVEKGGTDVLLVRPAIINLEIEAPENMEDPTETTFSASAGQMTLYVELYDSVTSDILVRAIDPEAGDDGGFVTRQDSVTNTAEARHIMKKWAKTLRNAMDEARRGH
jgi:hypothetical protein